MLPVFLIELINLSLSDLSFFGCRILLSLSTDINRSKTDFTKNRTSLNSGLKILEHQYRDFPLNWMPADLCKSLHDKLCYHIWRGTENASDSCPRGTQNAGRQKTLWHRQTARDSYPVLFPHIMVKLGPSPPPKVNYQSCYKCKIESVFKRSIHGAKTLFSKFF